MSRRLARRGVRLLRAPTCRCGASWPTSAAARCSTWAPAPAGWRSTWPPAGTRWWPSTRTRSWSGVCAARGARARPAASAPTRRTRARSTSGALIPLAILPMQVAQLLGGAARARGDARRACARHLAARRAAGGRPGRPLRRRARAGSRCRRCPTCSRSRAGCSPPRRSTCATRASAWPSTATARPCHRRASSPRRCSPSAWTRSTPPTLEAQAADAGFTGAAPRATCPATRDYVGSTVVMLEAPRDHACASARSTRS